MNSEDNNIPSLQQPSTSIVPTPPIAPTTTIVETPILKKGGLIRIFDSQVAVFLVFMLALFLFVRFGIPLSPVLSIVFFLILSFIFDATGNKVEGSTIRKTLLKIFLVIVALGIIGFGVCLFILAGNR